MNAQPKAKRPSRSRQGELQRMLGEAGTVLPRQEHGTMERRAQGWYAELVDGSVVFLGDYTTLAAVRIRQLVGGEL